MLKLVVIVSFLFVVIDANTNINGINLTNRHHDEVVGTRQYLVSVNRALKLVTQHTSTDNIYDMIMKILKFLKMYKFWIPCATDVATLVNATRRGLDEMWALNMIDSGTKLPSGILAGNIVDLGQYDECVMAQHGNITGQHCLISFILHLPDAQDNPDLEMLGGSLTLTMAQCFPASCEPYMLRLIFGEIGSFLSYLLKSTNISVSVNIPDQDCHTQYSRLGPDTAEISILVVLVVLLVIVSAMTTVDYILLRKTLKDRKPAAGELVVQAFSVYTNGKKLCSLKQNSEQMNCLNGIKFLSIGWVAIGHRYRYAVTVPLVNLLRVPQMIQWWSEMLILNAVLSVDTFFLMSGLLNAYGFCIIRDKIKGFGILSVLQSYIHRYVRLTPAYLVMIAMTATWIYRIGDGPLWDRMVGAERNSCRQTFWANLAYLNNYLTPDNNCMMQSWYLAADMQMFWVSPFVIYPLWRWPIFGYVYISILTALSVAAPACVAYFYNIRTPIPVTTDPVEESKEMDQLYFPTHTKTVSYVVGILVGYILYRIRVKKNMRVRMNTITASVGWILAMASMLYALFGGHYLYIASKPYTLLESSLYIGFYRFFWALGVGWVIFACVTGYGGVINSFLSLNIFGPLGRLSYCIYLTHIFIILYKFGSMRTAIYFTDYEMLEGALGDMVIIVLFAAAVSLVCESPIMTLEKLILGRGSGGSKRKPPKAGNETMKTEDRTKESNILGGTVTMANGDEKLSDVPSAPQVELGVASVIDHYPEVPEISTLPPVNLLAANSTNINQFPPPSYDDPIYAQIMRKRTLSSGDSGFTNHTSA